MKSQMRCISIKLCTRMVFIVAAMLYTFSLRIVVHHQMNLLDDAYHIRPPSTEVYQIKGPDDKSLVQAIAQKWNLTAPHATYLLSQQLERDNDYDPRRDFLHFHHIAKTGGTSISDLLEAIFKDGTPNIGDHSFVSPCCSSAISHVVVSSLVLFSGDAWQSAQQ